MLVISIAPDIFWHGPITIGRFSLKFILILLKMTLCRLQTITHSTNHSNWYQKLKKSTLTSNTLNYFIDVGVVAVADCLTGVVLDLKGLVLGEPTLYLVYHYILPSYIENNAKLAL